MAVSGVVGLVRRGVRRPAGARPAADRGRPPARRGRQSRRRRPRGRVRTGPRAGALDDGTVRHGSVVIAAITSCTNTSNPSVMLAAGLLARKRGRGGSADPGVGEDVAGSRGRASSPTTSTRRGSRRTWTSSGSGSSVTAAPPASATAGRCPDEVAAAVEERDLNVVAVLSGNRNFEGRIHPQVRASYLASPPLVVAYALAGRVDLDLTARTARRGDRRRRCTSATSGRARRDRRRRRDAITEERFRRSTRRSGTATSAGKGFRRRRGRPTRGTPARPTSRSRPSSPGSPRPPIGDIDGRPVPGEGRRLDHHRPHLAGRIDQADSPPAATWSSAASSSATSTATARGAGTTR